MPRLWCGASGYSYQHWRTVFYPAELPQSKWLEYYAQHFDTVELNNPFYRLPERATFEKWRQRTPDGFVFAVKASRYLTHVKKLADPEEPLARILSHSEGLGEKRGPILYQFPPGWAKDIGRLEAFLRLLPRDLRHVFEFRNDSWHCEEVWSLLERHGAAYCIMSSPGLPLHLKLTADFAYIRMHSGGVETGSNYSDQHLALWASRVLELLSHGDTYVYFNNDYRGYAVRNALVLKQMVTEAAPAS
jgi:uncharacterized protein YecE (DUF72 family)